MLHHGGRLRAASQTFDIPLHQWLDLSTGINLLGWPVPPIPPDCWLRLPEDEDDLEAAARDYYGAAQLLPTAGSQAAIQALPLLRPASKVAVLSLGYAEHAAAWAGAGHQVSAVAADHIERRLPDIDTLVLIHPCNPSGQRFSCAQLLQWHQALSSRGGCLVVDEAFMDVTPDQSLCAHSHLKGLVVLRSLGKFFGMAGARVGFVCAEPELLGQLRELLGPWALNAPARWAASAALRDTHWQVRTRERLLHDEQRMVQLLTQAGLPPQGGTALFQWHCRADAFQLHRALAQHAVFTRLFEQPSAVRFGLPASQAQWQQLEQALESIARSGFADAPHSHRPG